MSRVLQAPWDLGIVRIYTSDLLPVSGRLSTMIINITRWRVRMIGDTADYLLLCPNAVLGRCLYAFWLYLNNYLYCTVNLLSNSIQILQISLEM